MWLLGNGNCTCKQVPSTIPQRLQITAGDVAKSGGKPTPAAKENGSSDSGSVPVTANSANGGGSLDGAAAGGPAEVDGEPEAVETPGQLVELKFRAPKAGKYDLTLYCISGQAPSPTDHFFSFAAGLLAPLSPHLRLHTPRLCRGSVHGAEQKAPTWESSHGIDVEPPAVN